TNTLKFTHELSAPVNRIYERGIKIYGAATDGGAGTLIASVDALTTPLADAVMIQWNRLFTDYTFISTDTAYAYYFVKFTDGTTDSAASDYILATGWENNRIIKLIEHALDETDTQLDNKNINLDMCVQWANEAQDNITQFKHQDPVKGTLQHVDWDFEVALEATLAVETGEIQYNLSDLTTDIKYPDSDRAIISVKIGSLKPFEKITTNEYDAEMENRPKTEVATQAAAADTSLVVDSNVEFADSGTLYINDEVVTYTGKTGTTTFTGIPASGDGSITDTITVDSPVWQNIELGLPTAYTIFEGKLLFNRGFSSDYANYPINIRMYKKLTPLTEASDQTEVSFYNVFHSYIQGKIMRRKGDEEKAMLYLQEFQAIILNNALANDVPVLDCTNYYVFDDDDNNINYPLNKAY
ncbi:MAG: hypothetical protein KKD77_22400, partial [Gammaproteobacteria bacterium]|nr:hypothetical protein [Gammaproteobacteria bacterium]